MYNKYPSTFNQLSNIFCLSCSLGFVHDTNVYLFMKSIRHLDRILVDKVIKPNFGWANFISGGRPEGSKCNLNFQGAMSHHF
jgi:hypothetical protein